MKVLIVPCGSVCRVHDRKMSVLGLCAVLHCPVRPAAMLEVSASIIPAAIAQLEGLREAYKGELI